MSRQSGANITASSGSGVIITGGSGGGANITSGSSDGAGISVVEMEARDGILGETQEKVESRVDDGEVEEKDLSKTSSKTFYPEVVTENSQVLSEVIKPAQSKCF